MSQDVGKVSRIKKTNKITGLKNPGFFFTSNQKNVMMAPEVERKRVDRITQQNN